MEVYFDVALVTFRDSWSNNVRILLMDWRPLFCEQLEFERHFFLPPVL